MSPWRALILAAFAATAAAHAIKDDPEFLVEAEEEAAKEVGSEKQEPLKDQATLHNTETKASAKNAEPVKTKSLLAKASQAKVEVTKPHPVKATVAAKAKAPAKVAHTKAKPANAELTKIEKAKVEPTKSHPVKVNATVVAAKAKATPAEAAQTKAVPAMAKPAKSESAKAQPAKAQPAKAAPLAAEKTKTAEPMVAKAEDSDADDDDIVRFTGKTAETADWGEEYEGHMTAMERTNFYAKYYSREAARGKHFRLQVPEPEQMPGVHSGAGRMAAALAPVAILLSF